MTLVGGNCRPLLSCGRRMANSSRRSPENTVCATAGDDLYARKSDHTPQSAVTSVNNGCSAALTCRLTFSARLVARSTCRDACVPTSAQLESPTISWLPPPTQRHVPITQSNRSSISSAQRLEESTGKNSQFDKNSLRLRCRHKNLNSPARASSSI